MQEILTYIIIAAAFFYAGYKVALVFRHGKKPQHKFKAVKPDQHGGCDDCPAECMMRDFQAESGKNLIRPEKIKN